MEGNEWMLKLFVIHNRFPVVQAGRPACPFEKNISLGFEVNSRTLDERKREVEFTAYPLFTFGPNISAKFFNYFFA